MVLFNLHAHGCHGSEHFAAHILCGVLRGNGEVTAFGGNAVTEIAAFIFGVAIDRQFRRIELETGVVGVGHEAHIVKDEEFSFGADIDRVTDTG